MTVSQKPILHTTISEILKRPAFAEASVIASEKALRRTVTWVHIVEVTHLDELLNGNELVLTTGIGWHDREQLSVSFLRQLIESGVSGLCVEMGTYTDTLPESMISLAKAHDFPIILFHKKVRYVDITQDLHSMFIHQHYEMVKELEQLSQSFNHLLLSGKGIRDLLKEFNKSTGLAVCYLPIQGESYFVPNLSIEEQERKVSEWVHHKTMEETPYRLFRPIIVLDQHFADLIVFDADRKCTEFDQLAFERCATAVSQEVMRTAYMQERQQYKKNQWIHDWLHNKHHPRDIEIEIKRTYKGTINEAVIGLIENPQLQADVLDKDSFFIQKLMIARSVFKEQGILLLSSMFEDFFVFILLNEREQGRELFRQRLFSSLHTLQSWDGKDNTAFFQHMVFGKVVKNLNHVSQSFISAKDTNEVKKKIGYLSIPFYENLHIFRTILQMEEQKDIDDFIDDYLGVLIDFDQLKQGQLLKTLKVYLNCFGSKQETAKALYIVRQTLYHRLKKIHELLGEDIIKAPKRLSLELAMHAYEYKYGEI
ncbi:PucR family transcriptional regulator [Alteribacillus sp. YIM 98480]|uniref:PucR family transcriptional regulator n=1 Tax=Alteribacillus sp. YIM 98480 TaxID=2606599 RepID=UPI00131AEC75|nr:PucR family transcriptional regulator [Alteribacillus sp. YIM 98480]